MPKRICTGMVLAFALALAGCSDFVQQRFGGLRRQPDPREGLPRPSPELAINGTPNVHDPKLDPNLKQAGFAPDREPPPMFDPPGMQNPLRVLHERASQRYVQMDSYIFRSRSREMVNGKKVPEQIVLVKHRRQPFSIYMKWLGDEGKGREAIYVAGKHDNKIQVQLGPNDLGSLIFKRQSFTPDDPLIRSHSRYPITEAGLGSMIDHYGSVVARVEKGDPSVGVVKYLQRLKRPEFPGQVDAVHQVFPSGSDPMFPKGGQRWWYFDTVTGLPILRIAHDSTGEVEYYCHDHIQWPVRLDDDDFNPNKLWKK